MQALVGKLSFSDADLEDNINTFVKHIVNSTSFLSKGGVCRKSFSVFNHEPWNNVTGLSKKYCEGK